MASQELAPLLAAVYSPSTPPDQKRAAEAALQQLAATPQALEWALGALSNAAAPGADLQALFFACSVADEAVAFRWARLEAGGQAALRSALWRAATEPGGPHFVRQKAAAALAHVACLDWPERLPSFWPDLQTCLADPARRACGVDLLAITLEHFHTLAQTTSAGLKGRVLSAAVPDIQRRYSELQPVALATLVSLLQLLTSSLPAAAAAGGGNDSTLALAVRTLRALRAALADANRLPEQQGISSAALVALLFEFVGAARLAPADGDDEAGEQLSQVAAAALDCAADLQAKYLGTEATQQMLEELLPRLQATCGLVRERWARQGDALQLDDPLATSFVRLLVQFFTMQLSNVDATPQLGAALQGLLAQVLALTSARRSPIDALLFLEVWHAVLSYLDSFEDALWEAGDDFMAQQHIKKAAAGYKEPILAVSDLLLSALCPAGGAAAPLSLGALSSTPSSGTAMEDWLQSVVSGGDVGLGDEAAGVQDEAAADEDEYEEELLVPGAARGFQGDSEYDVWVRHAEGFLGRAIGSFSSDLLPAVLLRFQGAGATFAQACQAAAAGVAQAVAGGSPAASPAAALDGWLPAFRAMDICLRLLTRCGPSFPTRGAADSSAGLAPPAGSGDPVTGAHAAQCLRATFQLAGGWLQAVQAIAAASQQQGQQQGQPATPSLAAAAAGGGGEGGGLPAMLLAGSRLYKAAGSLTATWLSQLLAGLVQGSADPDAGAVAQQLVQGLLSTAAALLQAVASPHLAGWQPLLHRAAVWAAESLLSLSSIALSSALKPPAQLLEGVWRSQEVQTQLRPVAQASLANPTLLPVRASRALWLSLSDLCLRCWPAQPAAQFDAATRGVAFADLVGALALTLQQAAAAGQAAGGGEAEAAAAAAARHAAAVAAAVVQSYAGSPKAVRGIVSGALVGPALPSVLAILQARPGSSASGAAGQAPLQGKASAALLRLVAASLEVLATELGSEAVEQLLGALVQIFGAAGGDPSFESDLLMLQLVVSLLSQGGAHKHAQLLLPAVHYCLAVWERASAPHATGATNADVQHVRAAALSALLSLLRYRWKALIGSSNSGGGSAPPAGSLAQQAAAAAAAGGQAGEAGSEGAAIIARALQLLLEFFGAAASLAVVLPAADVRLVLEELFELQVATRLYSLPLFQGARAPLAACLLGMLLSRLYRSAQDELGDTLFALAAANWSEWHLSTLPGVVDTRLGGVGPSERGALLALWGGADLDAHSFERHLHAFLNDAAHYERSCSGAA